MPDDTTTPREPSRRTSWTAEVRARLEQVPLSPAREAEIIEELSEHLDDRWRELVSSGMEPDAARQVALAELHADRLARYLSPLRQARWIDTAPPAASRPFSREGLMLDLRQAVRSLGRTRGFTLAALAVLALGIGATTAIFSVVDAVVLRPLPFDEPDRLLAIGERPLQGKGGPQPGPGGPPPPKGKAPMGVPVPVGMQGSDPQALQRVQPQNFLDWLAEQRAFEALGVHAEAEMALQLDASSPEDVYAQRATASLLEALRLQPAAGRLFTADNEIEGRERVAVLTDAFWRHRLGGAADAVGRTIRLDGHRYEVIGILPPGVTYPVGTTRATDLFVPYVVPPDQRTRTRGISIYLQGVGRLKPGMTLAQAQTDMDRVANAIAAANPGRPGLRGFAVRPLRDHIVGASIRSWMTMMLAAVALVLLIACANVANLLLARASGREREVAIRAALGAGRWRLVRQLLVESLVLAALGAVLGLTLAWWLVPVLRDAIPEGIPRVAPIALDLRVLAASIGVALATGVLFGVVPALQVSRPNLAGALSGSARAVSVGRGRGRARAALMVGEIALAVVLLIGSALFIGSFARLMRVDPGFDPHGVVTMQLYARAQPGEPPRDWSAAFDQIVERLGHTPGVVRAGAVSPGLPLRIQLHISGITIPSDSRGMQPISVKTVTPGYHAAMGIPLRSGRLFNVADSSTGGAVILNQTAVRTYFDGADPVGRQVNVSNVDCTIVGVVSDVRQANLEAAPMAEAYLPMAPGRTGTGFLVVRTSGDPKAMLPAVRAAVAGVLPDVPPRYLATMDALLAREMAERRLNMLVLGLFGLLGLAIATAGVYGVMAYAVAQRTREIGVRMALGATRAQVVGMILANAGMLVAAGLAIGSAGAWYLSASAKAFLFGLEPTDLRAFVVAGVALAIAALVATAIPARRAASVDPTVALRES